MMVEKAKRHLGLIVGAVVVLSVSGLSIAQGSPNPFAHAAKKKAKRGPPGPPGPQGPPGTNGVNGTNGIDGAAGTARAFGLVSATAGLSRSKNVASVTHGDITGTYCIALAAGIDPSATGLVATPDRSSDDTLSSPTPRTTHAEFWSLGTDSNCPAGRLEVVTYLVDTGNTTSVAVTGGGGGTVAAPSYRVTLTNEPFFFVVP